MTAIRDDDLWVIIALANQLFALPALDVHGMSLIPDIASVPQTQDHIRGIATLRGTSIPVVDLRIRLGMPSLEAEIATMVAMLDQREAEHVAWLEELEASVKEGREFTLATNPHECAFGKWYDTFATDNLLLASLLKKFDAPHRRIHAIATEVLSLEKTGKHESAQGIIDATRSGDLAVMVSLFDQLRTQMRGSMREIVVVLTSGEKEIGVAVDSIETVGRLVAIDDDDYTNAEFGLAKDRVVVGVGMLEKSDSLALVLEPEGIID